MSDTERVPPHSQEAETAVLGSIMLEPAALLRVIPIVKPEHFYRVAHQKLYAAALELFHRREPVDVLSIREQLKKAGDDEVASNADLFVTLSGAVPSIANAEHYARIVFDKAVTRRVITAANELLVDAYEDKRQPGELVSRAQCVMLQIGQGGAALAPVPVSTILEDVVSRAVSGEDPTPTYPSGLFHLDRVLGGGFRKGQFAIIGGRPGSGKSTIALTILAKLIKSKIPSYFASLETQHDDLIKNMLCCAAHITANQLDKRELNDHEWKRVKNAASQLYAADTFIDDRGGLSITEFRARAQSLQLEHGTEVAILDYAQLMSGSEERGRNWSRLQELTDISRGLKCMAMDLQMVVIALCQLSRLAVNDTPQLHHLRESGAFEQDADCVILIDEHPPAAKNQAGNVLPEPVLGEDDRRCDLRVAKQRRGPTRAVPMIFQANFMRYREYDATTKEPEPEPATERQQELDLDTPF